MRQRLSQIAYALGVGCQLNRLTRRLNRHKVVILSYHRLHAGEADTLDNFDGQYVHVEDFARQMRYLARHYHVVPLEQCVEPFPDGQYRAVVTFDDAYASIYHHAYPVLRDLRLPATVFVPTDFIQMCASRWWDRLRLAIRQTEKPAVVVTYNDRHRVLSLTTTQEKEAALRELAVTLQTVPEATRNDLFATLYPPRQLKEVAKLPRNAPLTPAQMREMSAHGITFAGHGKSHTSFLTLTRAELWQEVCDSKALIEKWTGKEVTLLSYPFGDFDTRALELLPYAGYRAAVTTIDGLSSDENRFALRRLAVGGQTTFAQFVAAVSGLRDIVARVIRRRDWDALP
jgi:peptidoglycan/xylan/chitin deacetylase (PgdA/CDA1 family)